MTFRLFFLINFCLRNSQLLKKAWLEAIGLKEKSLFWFGKVLFSQQKQKLKWISLPNCRRRNVSHFLFRRQSYVCTVKHGYNELGYNTRLLKQIKKLIGRFGSFLWWFSRLLLTKSGCNEQKLNDKSIVCLFFYQKSFKKFLL